MWSGKGGKGDVIGYSVISALLRALFCKAVGERRFLRYKS